MILKDDYSKWLEKDTLSSGDAEKKSRARTHLAQAPLLWSNEIVGARFYFENTLITRFLSLLLGPTWKLPSFSLSNSSS